MDYDAIVIGSGVGGLAAGGALAARGLRTVILEQAGFVGGCASSFSAEGFTFDVGACIIEMAKANISGASGKSYLVKTGHTDLCRNCPFFRSCWKEEEYSGMVG